MKKLIYRLWLVVFLSLTGCHQLKPEPPAVLTPTPTPHLVTVNDYLTTYHIPADLLPAALLSQNIDHLPTINNSQLFLLVYWGEDEEKYPPPLNFFKIDKTIQNWEINQVYAPEPAAQQPFCLECFQTGAINPHIVETAHFYLVDIHLNPSAGWTVIVNHKLQLQAVLFGQVEAILADETFVYEQGQIHFAPTHSATLTIFNPFTQAQTTLFPQKPYQKVWQTHQTMVAQTYEKLGPAWCQANNHHCQAELMNYDLEGAVEVNLQTDALAFQVHFVGETGLNLPQDNRAFYFYRGLQTDALEYREVTPEQLQQLFGSFRLVDLLQPEKLDLIFTQVTFQQTSP